MWGIQHDWHLDTVAFAEGRREGAVDVSAEHAKDTLVSVHPDGRREELKITPMPPPEPGFWLCHGEDHVDVRVAPADQGVARATLSPADLIECEFVSPRVLKATHKPSGDAATFVAPVISFESPFSGGEAPGQEDLEEEETKTTEKKKKKKETKKRLPVYACDVARDDLPGVGEDKSICVVGGPDGRLVALHARGERRGGGVVRRMTGHVGDVNSVAVLPLSQVAVSGAADFQAKLWLLDIARNTLTVEKPAACVQTFTGHTGGVLAVGYLANGRRVLTGSRDRTGGLWDVPTGNRLSTFACVPLFGAVHGLCALGEESVAFACSDGRIATFDTRADGKDKTWEAVVADQGDTTFVAAVSDHELVCGFEAGTVRLFDVRVGDKRPRWTHNCGAAPRSCAVSNGTTVIVGDAMGGCEALHAQSGESTGVMYTGLDWPVLDLATDPRRRMLWLAGDDGSVSASTIE